MKKTKKRAWKVNFRNDALMVREGLRNPLLSIQRTGLASPREQIKEAKRNITPAPKEWYFKLNKWVQKHKTHEYHY